MGLTYKDLEILWEYPKEITDEEELSNFDIYHNDFTGKEEHNICITLRVEDKVYQGSDIQFEEILNLFENHKFKEIKTNNKYVTSYEGYLETESDDYFTLEYNGGYISKFDLLHVNLKGSKSAFNIIKAKYNL